MRSNCATRLGKVERSNGRLPRAAFARGRPDRRAAAGGLERRFGVAPPFRGHRRDPRVRRWRRHATASCYELLDREEREELAERFPQLI
jgi:hypothetical protein